MGITINRLNTRHVNGAGSDVFTVYLASADGKEFTITCKSNFYGRNLGLVGEEGTLYIDTEKNKVYRQTIALGGGCGLLIDDVPVEGLSPWAIRGISIGEKNLQAQ